MSDTRTHIIGFGPGAVSFFVAADRLGVLREMLRAGVHIHESQPTLDALLQTGINYTVVSNSYASDFVEGICPDGIFGEVLCGPVVKLMRAFDKAPVPLTLVAALIHELRVAVLAVLADYTQCTLHLGARVTRIEQTATGVRLIDQTGTGFDGSRVALACGSTPTIPMGLKTAVSARGLPLLHAERILRPNGLKLISQAAKQVLLIGGSHSAFSVAHQLLNGPVRENLKITLLHRQRIRRMFLTAQDALDAGERFDPQSDICAGSGRVFRFQGLYTQSRDLFDRVTAGQHPCVTLLHDPEGAQLPLCLDAADVVIASTGYRPRVPQISDRSGQLVVPGRNGSSVHVNAVGELCDEAGQSIRGLFGLGLGFGRRQHLLGEPSYEGAPVGINFFQGPDGAALCQRMIDQTPHTRRKVG